MFRLPWLAAILVAASPSLAAEKLVQKSVSVASGEASQIGVFGRVTPECTNGKVDIRLAEKPQNGTVTPKSATIKAGKIAKCPALEAKAAVIFYRSDPGFTGTDRLAIVVETDDGQAERHEYTITVE